MTELVEETEYLGVKQRCRRHVNQTISRMKPIVKDWFLDVAYKYINSRKFTAQEEDILEKVTDYYLENLATL